MQADLVLEKLFELHDAGNTAGIIQLVAQARTNTSRAAAGPKRFVAIRHDNKAIHVKLFPPRVDERAALVIRTELSQAMLFHDGELTLIELDFSNVGTIDGAALRLMNDLRRNARVFGARVTTIGVPDDIERSVKRIGMGEKRGLFSRLRAGR